MQTVALGIVVYARTGQPGWTGLVAAAAFVPIGLLAPVGGALADRLDRRRWLMVTTTAELAFAALLAVLAATGHDSPVLLVSLAFMGGASAAIGFPAYQAIVPDLVPPEDLLGAVSLSSAQFNLGRVIGPALAGVALLGHDYGLVFGINAASFGAVLGALALVRLPPPVTSGRDAQRLTSRLADGVASARSEAGCRAAIGLIGVVALTASPFIALVPAMSGVLDAAGHGHRPFSIPESTALFVTVQGIGAVVGALALPVLAQRVGRRRVLVSSLFLLPLVLAAYGVAPDLWSALIVFLAVGGVYIAVLSGLNTVVQLRAPATSRGRVLGIYMMALGILYPAGAVIQGAVADRVGVRAVTVAGAAVLAAALTVMILLRPAVLTALDDRPAGVTPDRPPRERRGIGGPIDPADEVA